MKNKLVRNRLMVMCMTAAVIGTNVPTTAFAAGVPVAQTETAGEITDDSREVEPSQEVEVPKQVTPVAPEANSKKANPVQTPDKKKKEQTEIRVGKQDLKPMYDGGQKGLDASEISVWTKGKKGHVTDQKATVLYAKREGGSESNPSVEAPTDAGSYVAIVSYAGGDDYERAEDVRVSFEIRKSNAKVSVSVDSLVVTYGDITATKLPNLTFQSRGLVERDKNQLFVYSVPDEETGNTIQNVGIHRLTVHPGIIESIQKNYKNTIEVTDGTITVNPKGVTLEAKKDVSKVYDGQSFTVEDLVQISGLTEWDEALYPTMSDLGVKYNYQVYNSDTKVTTSEIPNEVGKYLVKCSVDDTSKLPPEYTFIGDKFVEVNVEITKADLYVSASAIPTEKTYDGKYWDTDQGFEVTLEGAVDDITAEDIPGLQVAHKITNVDTHKVLEGSAKDAGRYHVCHTVSIKEVRGEARNYNVIPKNVDDESVVNLVINQATINVTPKAGQWKYVGDKDPEIKYTATGIVKGEKPALKVTRAAGEKVGTYAYEYAVDDANYKVVGAKDTKFEIKAKPVKKDNTKKAAKTGDVTQVAKYVVSIITAGLAMVVVMLRRRKRF